LHSGRSCTHVSSVCPKFSCQRSDLDANIDKIKGIAASDAPVQWIGSKVKFAHKTPDLEVHNAFGEATRARPEGDPSRV
jgi:hypothetical protein